MQIKSFRGRHKSKTDLQTALLHEQLTARLFNENSPNSLPYYGRGVILERFSKSASSRHQLSARLYSTNQSVRYIVTSIKKLFTVFDQSVRAFHRNYVILAYSAYKSCGPIRLDKACPNSILCYLWLDERSIVGHSAIFDNLPNLPNLPHSSPFPPPPPLLPTPPRTSI